MFDTFINRKDTFQFHHTVVEKRAPTDESIALLREMEQKVEEKWTHSFRLDNTHLDGVVHSYTDYQRMHQVFAVIVNINGKTLRIDHIVKDIHKTREEVVGELVFAVAQQIAIRVVCPAFTKALKEAA